MKNSFLSKMNWRLLTLSNPKWPRPRTRIGSSFKNNWLFEQNFHILSDCDKLLFANQQLNFNFDTVSSLLSMIHASVKSYRSALFAFRMDILNWIPVLLKGYFPMLLIPMESLLAIIDSVSLRQSKVEDRLTLAIPASDLLSYYDCRLLADAITASEGLLLTLNIPLASQQTVSTLFEAKLIPMPFPDDPQTGLTWSIEAPYLTLSEKNLNRPSYLRNSLSTVSVRRSTEFAPKLSQRR